ncbi:MAG: hypothetical protein ACFCVF_01135 [Kineosporiaceae bacterium]
MARPSRYPLQLRERAVRMVAEVRPDYPSEWAADLVNRDFTATAPNRLAAAVDAVLDDEQVRRWDSALPARLQSSLGAHITACRRRL